MLEQRQMGEFEQPEGSYAAKEICIISRGIVRGPVQTLNFHVVRLFHNAREIDLPFGKLSVGFKLAVDLIIVVKCLQISFEYFYSCPIVHNKD